MYDDYDEQENRNIKGKIIIVSIVTLLIAALIIITSIFMKVIQLDEIGNFSDVFLKNLTYQVAFGVISFVVIFIVIYITTFFIKRNIKDYLKNNGLPQRKMMNMPVAFVIALVGAFITKEFFYQKALTFLNSTPFGKSDPLFYKDIGYYIFERPFLMAIYDFVFGLGMFVIIYTIVYYLAILVTVFENNLTFADLKIKTVIRHNLINIALLFIIKAFSYKFAKEGILYSNVVDVNGASFVDANIWLNYFKFAPFLLTLIVIVSFMFIWRGKLKGAAYTIAVFPVVWLLVTLIAAGVQGFLVKPNEVQKEENYLRYNMMGTREAYNLNEVKVIESPDIKELTPEIINRNLDTKNNIRIVDYNATLESNIQLQSNTNFYTFNNGDIINYNINGKDTPVFITAREIDKSRLKENNYINSVFNYTHGYGVVINPINKTTPEGQVDFILSGLRMDSQAANLTVKEPRIYYGELTRDYVIVNPKGNKEIKEVDYDGNKETTYAGKGGIQLSFLNRILFAFMNGDFNMIVSENVSSSSKILINRNIIERAEMAVPFLRIDDDPYIILTDDGRLKWVVDAYTTTNYYPYSENYGNFNYIRNSVKIIIDAYDGSVKCYIIDKNDPIIMTYNKIYPGVFSTEPLPDDIAEHMKYPEELFMVQTEIIKRYHLDPEAKNSVDIFYNNSDMWEIAKYAEQGNLADTTEDGMGAKDIEPYYNMIKLPRGVGETEELILMRPFTPSGKRHNMVSWLAIRNSIENYGEMVLFEFPKNTNILGPDQVDVNINQIAEVSRDISLWNQKGSRAFKGNLLVIPIEDSILYVEPIYIQSNSASSIPQVKKVVVGYQQENDFKAGVGTNLDDALENLFKGTGQTAPVEPSGPEPTDDADIPQPTASPGAPADVGREELLDEITKNYGEIKKQLDELGKLIEDLKNE